MATEALAKNRNSRIWVGPTTPKEGSETNPPRKPMGGEAPRYPAPNPLGLERRRNDRDRARLREIVRDCARWREHPSSRVRCGGHPHTATTPPDTPKSANVLKGKRAGNCKKHALSQLIVKADCRERSTPSDANGDIVRGGREGEPQTVCPTGGITREWRLRRV